MKDIGDNYLDAGSLRKVTEIPSFSTLKHHLEGKER